MKSKEIKRVPALKPGDRVRLVAPASPFEKRKFELGVRRLVGMGFEPVWDRREFTRTGFLAGGDDARAERLERALVEDESQAVWCIRGGYGTARVIERVDLERIRQAGKLLIGFSDVTALMVNICAPGGCVCVHGPVITQLGRVPGGSVQWLMRIVTRPEAGGRVPLGRVRTLVGGRARGRLVGGNLSVLVSLVGTPWLPSLAGAILIIEDVGEQAYRLDRLWCQLRQSGSLRGVVGVVVGSLEECEPAGRGRWSARSVLDRAVAEWGVPAVSGASFGHIDRNVALPMGVLAQLDAGRKSLTLLEPAVC